MNNLISVCICTYKRPHLLKTLLKSLLNQQTDNVFVFDIIIVDNDNLRSAEAIVKNFQNQKKIDIVYSVEERKNIALARNKAVQIARGDLIAFIDDDEIPTRFWLLTLYKALLKFKADAVMGPVFPVYKVKPPKWVLRGNFHKRPTYKTGFFCDWTKGRTGNLLIKKSLFNNAGIYFNPKFGQGGEDQDLTRRMLEKGYKFIWCNEARIYEIIPPERWNLVYMLKKAFIRGKMSAQYPGPKIIKIIKSLIALIIYTLSLPFLIFIGYHTLISYMIKISDHLGRILAILKLVQ